MVLSYFCPRLDDLVGNWRTHTFVLLLQLACFRRRMHSRSQWRRVSSLSHVPCLKLKTKLVVSRSREAGSYLFCIRIAGLASCIIRIVGFAFRRSDGLLCVLISIFILSWIKLETTNFSAGTLTFGDLLLATLSFFLISFSFDCTDKVWFFTNLITSREMFLSTLLYQMSSYHHAQFDVTLIIGTVSWTSTTTNCLS